MEPIKDALLEVIQARAEDEARTLAGAFAHAASRDKEAILAELEFEQELLAGCRQCLKNRV